MAGRSNENSDYLTLHMPRFDTDILQMYKNFSTPLTTSIYSARMSEVCMPRLDSGELR